jgi:sialic acid synthase SpsE
MGARTIEKHFTIDRKLPDSPDHLLSVDPEELAEMIILVRRVEAAQGTFVDGHYPAEENAWRYARKSLVAARAIPKGTVITKEMLTSKRPGTGIYPELIDSVVGRVANVEIAEDTTLTRDMLG